MPQTCYRENQLNSYTITLHASSTTHSKITLMTDFDFPLPKKFRAEKGRQKKGVHGRQNVAIIVFLW